MMTYDQFALEWWRDNGPTLPGEMTGTEAEELCIDAYSLYMLDYAENPL